MKNEKFQIVFIQTPCYSKLTSNFIHLYAFPNLVIFDLCVWYCTHFLTFQPDKSSQGQKQQYKQVHSRGVKTAGSGSEHLLF